MLDSGLQDQGADGLPRHLHEDTRGTGPRKYRDHIPSNADSRRRQPPPCAVSVSSPRATFCDISPVSPHPTVLPAKAGTQGRGATRIPGSRKSQIGSRVNELGPDGTARRRPIFMTSYGLNAAIGILAKQLSFRRSNCHSERSLCHSEQSRRIYVRPAVTPCPPTPRSLGLAQAAIPPPSYRRKPVPRGEGPRAYRGHASPKSALASMNSDPVVPPGDASFSPPRVALTRP